jgi:hypothetical protein
MVGKMLKRDFIRQSIVLFLGLGLLVSGCNLPGDDQRQTAEPSSDCTPVLPHIEGEGEPYQTVLEPFDMLAPSGNRIYGFIRRPDPEIYPDHCFPAVVFVPGGTNPGRMEALGEDAILLAQAGMVVVTFNAEGRGSNLPEDITSEGTRDYNGFRQQDGLCALVEYTIDLPYVVSDNVGVRTHSFGIAMGAGCAGRHPEVPIKYIVDGEGPPNSYVTCHEPAALDNDPSNDKHELIYSLLGHYSTERDPSPENIAFWEEREAVRFIGNFRGRYLRLQGTWDHAQQPSSQEEAASFEVPPDWWQNKHTTIMVNAAIAGGVPWVRVNFEEQGNLVNATYDFEHRPVFLPGELADRP